MSLSRSARWIVIPLLMLLVLFAAAAEAETARDLTAECTYSFSKGSNRNTNVLYDHDYKKIWKSDKSKNNYLEVHLPEGETCSGVQIKWASIQNRRWCVEVQQGGEWVAVDAFNEETPVTVSPVATSSAICVRFMRSASSICDTTSVMVCLYALCVLSSMTVFTRFSLSADC